MTTRIGIFAYFDKVMERARKSNIAALQERIRTFTLTEQEGEAIIQAVRARIRKAL